MARGISTRTLALALIILVLVGGGAPARAARGQASAPRVAGPGAYYLSVGDGLAYGYQPFKPLTTGFGYSDVLASALETINPDLKPVNLGCPGETTITFMTGGCQGAIALRYTGSQLNATLSFLKAHPGQVSPITLALGAGDLLRVIADPSQLTVTLQSITKNENTIMMQLRQAAPKADIVVLNYYNPFTAVATNTLPIDTTPVVIALNGIISQAAARIHAKTVNLYSVFNTPVHNPLLCNLTWMCSNYHDIHGTILGYKVMERMIAATLGYPGLAPSPSATNPEGVSPAAPTAGGTLTWRWIGDQNATGYDVVVYHYGGRAIVVDKSDKVAAGQRSYVFSGGKCGVTYQLKVRSQGRSHPNAYYTPDDGGKVPCPAQ